MIQKELSEFSLDHVVYLKVGPHNHEPIDEIIKRKCAEVDTCGESLWAFSSNIANTVRNLCEEYMDDNKHVYAVFSMGGNDTLLDGKVMNYYGNGCEVIKIPDCMRVTASKSGDYALLVEEYFEVVGNQDFFTSQYDRNPKYYIRGFGFLSKISNEEKRDTCKKIGYVARLKAPFIVDVMEKSYNNN